MTRFVLAAVALLAPLAAFGCSAPAANSPATSAPQASVVASAAPARVAVTLKEFSIVTATPSSKAGDVTFEVKNDGKIPHQFVVVKSDLDPAALPLVDQKEVEEAKVQVVARITDFDGGESKTTPAKLAPGKYVLLCNVPSHYSSGMFVAFVVN